MSLHNTTIFDEFVLWDILYLFCGIDKHSAKCQKKNVVFNFRRYTPSFYTEKSKINRYPPFGLFVNKMANKFSHFRHIMK